MSSTSRLTTAAPRLIMLAAGCTLAAGSALAATPESLAVASGCSACHAADKKIVGPAYHDIAVKYKGDPGAPAMLAAKVRSGGKGVWGPVPMLPMDAKRISDADLNTLIAWILKQ